MSFILNAAQTAAVVLGFLLLGYALQRLLPFLKTNYVPAPLIGGLLLFIVIAAFEPIIQFTLDASLIPVFATAFFASIGLRSGHALMRQGVTKLGIFLGLVIAVALVQNILSISGGMLLGFEAQDLRLHGLLSFMGDMAQTPTSNSNVMPQLQGVYVLAVLVGTLIGGQVFKLLNRKVDLSQTLKPPAPSFTPLDFIKYIFVFGAAMSLGFMPSQLGLGQWLPPVGGAFLAGLGLRALLDRTKWMEIGLPQVNLLGNASLSLFLTLSFATLRWGTLQNVTPTGILLVMLQSALVMAISFFVSFKLFGKNALSAYIAAGLPGFSVGIPASTMSTLQCIQENHGALPLVLFVVPTVGAWISPIIIRLLF